MTEDIETQQLPPAATAPVDGGPPAQGAPSVKDRAASVKDRAATMANDRPEVVAGAAFAGGLVLALILKRIAR